MSNRFSPSQPDDSKPAEPNRSASEPSHAVEHYDIGLTKSSQHTNYAEYAASESGEHADAAELPTAESA